MGLGDFGSSSTSAAISAYFKKLKMTRDEVNTALIKEIEREICVTGEVVLSLPTFQAAAFVATMQKIYGCLWGDGEFLAVSVVEEDERTIFTLIPRIIAKANLKLAEARKKAAGIDEKTLEADGKSANE